MTILKLIVPKNLKGQILCAFRNFSLLQNIRKLKGGTKKLKVPKKIKRGPIHAVVWQKKLVTAIVGKKRRLKIGHYHLDALFGHCWFIPQVHVLFGSLEVVFGSVDGAEAAAHCSIIVTQLVRLSHEVFQNNESVFNVKVVFDSFVGFGEHFGCRVDVLVVVALLSQWEKETQVLGWLLRHVQPFVDQCWKTVQPFFEFDQPKNWQFHCHKFSPWLISCKVTRIDSYLKGLKTCKYPTCRF